MPRHEKHPPFRWVAIWGSFCCKNWGFLRFLTQAYPPGGVRAIFLFCNPKVFRKEGHCWEQKKINTKHKHFSDGPCRTIVPGRTPPVPGTRGTSWRFYCGIQQKMAGLSQGRVPVCPRDSNRCNSSCPLPVLPFLAFWGILLLFSLWRIPCLFVGLPFFSKDFQGSVEIESPCSLGGVLLFFPKASCWGCLRALFCEQCPSRLKWVKNGFLYRFCQCPKVGPKWVRIWVWTHFSPTFAPKSPLITYFWTHFRTLTKTHLNFGHNLNQWAKKRQTFNFPPIL